MSIDGIDNRAGIAALVKEVLAEPGVLPGPQPNVALRKNGVPADSDFPNPPKDGTTAFDRATSTLYVRDEDEWVAI